MAEHIPIVRVNERRGNRRPLHLVENLPYLLQVLKVSTIRVKCTLTSGASRQRVDDKLLHTAGMNLEVQGTGHRVLPELHAKLDLLWA